MSQAEKTMLRYQYVLANTGAAQGDFVRTSDTWANQIRILVQNIQQLAATLGGALINALKPVVKMLNLAMLQLNSFADTVVNALGKIFGWTYEADGTGGMAKNFSTAADSADDIASSTGKAAKNTKKIQEGIRAFDKLNVINLNKDTSGAGDGGGGGTAGAGAGAKGGKRNKGEGILQKYESEISTLEQLGKHIGDSLTKAMNNIQWDKIYAKAKNFGKGLASFLNGLISPQLFGALGRTIAGALNTALHFLNSFGTTFNWTNFGRSIATGINEFFKTFDFKLLADTLNTWANGLLDAAIEAVQNIDWEMIAQKIADFISELDVGGISWRLGKLVSSLANAFYILVSNKDTWSNLGQKIADGINGFLEGMSEVDPKTGLTGWEALGNNIIKTFTGIVTSLTTAIEKIKWNQVGQSIIKCLKSLITPENIKEVVDSIVGLFSSTLAASFDLGAEISDALFGTDFGELSEMIAPPELVEAFETLRNLKDSVLVGLQETLDFLRTTVLPDLKSGWDNLIQILEPFGEFLSNTFTSVWQDFISPALSYIGNTVVPAVTSTFENLWNNVLVPFGNFIKGPLGTAIQNLSNILSLLWNNIVVPLGKAVGEVLGKAWEGVVKIFNEQVIPKANSVIQLLQDLWNNALQPLADNLQTVWKPVFDTVFSAIKETIDGIKTTMSGVITFITGVFTGDWTTAWNGIKDIFKGIFNGMIAIVEGAVNLIINAINGIITGVNKIVTKVGKVIKLDLEIPQIPKVTLKRFAAGGFPPEDGWFRASKGEYFGQFDDGTSYIANNNQIEAGMAAGIEQAAYKGFMKALAEAGGNNTNVNIKIEGDRDKIFKVTREEARNFKARTGRPAFS